MGTAETQRKDVTDIRIYYEDTDAAGIVYYANYLKLAERGRTELLRRCGFDHRAIKEAHGVVFAVRHCAVDYQRPAHLDDLVQVTTRISRIGGASVEMEQGVTRGDEELAKVQVRLACIDDAGGVRRLPKEIRQAMEEWQKSAESLPDL